MNKQLDKEQEIEAIADKAQSGEDLSDYFTGRYVAKQNLVIDFPLTLLRLIDNECQKLGISRQAWITLACEDRLHRVQVNGDVLVVSAPTNSAIKLGA